MFIPCKMFTVKIFYPLDIVNCSCLLSIGTLLWTCTTEKDDFGDSPADLSVPVGRRRQFGSNLTGIDQK